MEKGFLLDGPRGYLLLRPREIDCLEKRGERDVLKGAEGEKTITASGIMEGSGGGFNEGPSSVQIGVGFPTNVGTLRIIYAHDHCLRWSLEENLLTVGLRTSSFAARGVRPWERERNHFRNRQGGSGFAGISCPA